MSFDLCICDVCKSIRKSKLIDLLRCTNVYVCKSWVMPLQWLCECCILVAACAQRRCCHSVYMSKDCVISLQCKSSNSALLMCWAHTQSKSEAITTRSSSALKLTHTQKNSNVFAYMLRLIYDIYTYITKARLSFCAHTDRRDAVNWSVFRIFRPIYTQRNHTQSSNSALFTCWAHIQHIHIYCEGTTQLLRTYRQMWCSKSIDFSHFQADLHAAQSHTEQ